jgi:Bacteriophage baseplate protein W
VIRGEDLRGVGPPIAGSASVRGPAFPFRIDPLSGSVQLASGDEKIRQNVRLILGTRLGERPMLRDFGTQLPALVQEPNDDVLVELARDHSTKALLRWEPRIYITGSDVERDPDLGVLQLRVTYVYANQQVAAQAVLSLT